MDVGYRPNHVKSFVSIFKKKKKERKKEKESPKEEELIANSSFQNSKSLHIEFDGGC
jgi:hypothetical protein